MITTLIFITIDEENCLMLWQAGWIAMFVAWINFIMYLRRYDVCMALNECFERMLCFQKRWSIKCISLLVYTFARRSLVSRYISWGQQMHLQLSISLLKIVNYIYIYKMMFPLLSTDFFKYNYSRHLTPDEKAIESTIWSSGVYLSRLNRMNSRIL